jgi:hypothetical protein
MRNGTARVDAPHRLPNACCERLHAPRRPDVGEKIARPECRSLARGGHAMLRGASCSRWYFASETIATISRLRRLTFRPIEMRRRADPVREERRASDSLIATTRVADGTSSLENRVLAGCGFRAS